MLTSSPLFSSLLSLSFLFCLFCSVCVCGRAERRQLNLLLHFSCRPSVRPTLACCCCCWHADPRSADGAPARRTPFSRSGATEAAERSLPRSRSFGRSRSRSPPLPPPSPSLFLSLSPSICLSVCRRVGVCILFSNPGAFVPLYVMESVRSYRS